MERTDRQRYAGFGGRRLRDPGPGPLSEQVVRLLEGEALPKMATWVAAQFKGLPDAPTLTAVQNALDAEVTAGRLYRTDSRGNYLYTPVS